MDVKRPVYEVRSQAYGPDRDDDGKQVLIDGAFEIETRRTSEKDAETDVALLKSLGKKAWIVEVA